MDYLNRVYRYLFPKPCPKDLTYITNLFNTIVPEADQLDNMNYIIIWSPDSNSNEICYAMFTNNVKHAHLAITPPYYIVNEFPKHYRDNWHEWEFINWVQRGENHNIPGFGENCTFAFVRVENSWYHVQCVGDNFVSHSLN